MHTQLHNNCVYTTFFSIIVFIDPLSWHGCGCYIITSQNILKHLKATVSMMDVQCCGRYQIMYSLYYYGSEGGNEDISQNCSLKLV